MAKYRLLSTHFSEEDKILEAGTLVGTGTIHKWTRPPTPEMQGIDKEGKEKVAEVKKRIGETLDPIDNLPLTMDMSFLNVQQGKLEKEKVDEEPIDDDEI